MKRAKKKTRSGIFSYTRRGATYWGCDYRAALTSKRKRKAGFATRDAAVLFLETKDKSRLGILPGPAADVTLRAYAATWLGIVKTTLKPSTYADYEGTMRVHILPALGDKILGTIDKAMVRDYLSGKLAAALSNPTVRLHMAVIRVCLGQAVDDGIIPSNPVIGLGRKLRLRSSRPQESEEIMAFDAGQLARFLETAKRIAPRLYPLWYTMAVTGMRPGEAHGLQWQDVDGDGQTILVQRTLRDGEVGPPKSGKSRRVDMPADLKKILTSLDVQAKAEAMKRGGAAPPWIFTTTTGTAYSQTNTGRTFARVLEKAELPGHFHPHCLRHTYASLMLQAKESIVYVQRQLGHASIGLTVDLYGRWLPMGDVAAADRLAKRIAEAA